MVRSTSQKSNLSIYIFIASFSWPMLCHRTYSKVSIQVYSLSLQITLIFLLTRIRIKVDFQWHFAVHYLVCDAKSKYVQALTTMHNIQLTSAQSHQTSEHTNVAPLILHDVDRHQCDSEESQK